MFVAMSFIPMGDTAGKLLANRHDVAPFFVAWSRFAIGATIAVCLLRSNPIPLFSDWRVWFRGALLAGGISSILTALSTEPIADVFAAFFVGPFFSYILAGLLLKEPLSWERTALLGLGFIGVLLAVKPGFGMTPGLGFAVLAGLFYGAFLTTSRWLKDVGTPRALLFSQLFIGALLTLPFGLANVPSMTVEVAGLTLASAVFSMAGNLLLLVAYQQAPASALAPFVYFQLVAATVLGWAVFHDLPDAITFLGLGLLLGSGFATLLLKPKAGT
jgi:drug/metabolite transporter (DMT)-like permease